jgi:hypothetical protein
VPRVGVTVALAGAATLAAAGCGGGRLSHGAFVQRADAICSAYDAQVKLLARPTSFAAVTAYVDRTLPLHVAATDDLRALKPPQQDAAAVRAWLAADGRVAAALRTLRAAAMRHDLAATNAASDALQAASLAARRAAGDVGLETCATP